MKRFARSDAAFFGASPAPCAAPEDPVFLKPLECDEFGCPSILDTFNGPVDLTIHSCLNEEQVLACLRWLRENPHLMPGPEVFIVQEEARRLGIPRRRVRECLTGLRVRV